MTNILLILIAVLLLARIALQVWHRKNGYTSEGEVENTARITSRDLNDICLIIGVLQNDGWELVAAHPLKAGREILFFTRKRIKRYPKQ